MNILFLCSRLPYPPNRGDKLRAYHLIRKLKAANHRLFLVSFIEAKSEYSHVNKLREWCAEVEVELLPPHKSYLKTIKGILSSKPLQVAFYDSKRMKRLIETVLHHHQIDIIFVHLFRMAPYVESIEGIYKIIDFTDVVSNHLKKSLPFRSWLGRYIYSFEVARIREYENRISREFDECWLISAKEAQILSDNSPLANIKIVPNGVDFNYFRPIEIEEKNCQLIFVGYLKSAYNVDAILFFCKHILPLVKKAIPSINFCIVGPNPHHRIRDLTTQEGIELKGYTEDLAGILNRSKVFVAPFRFCSGIQNKILEAMATGLPTVCTAAAAEGIEAGSQQGLLVADDPQVFSECVIELLRNDQRRKELGYSARQFVQERYDWNNAIHRINEIEHFLSLDHHTFEK